MPAQQQAFYNRLYILTVFLPVYLQASLFYGLAWYLSPLSPLAGVHNQQYPWAGLLLLLLIGSGPLLAGLGYAMSQVPQQLAHPDAAQRYRLAGLLQEDQETSAAEAKTAADERPRRKLRGYRLPDGARVEVALLKMGALPFLSISAGHPPRLWISSHTLETVPVDVLHAMLLHEEAHLQRPWPAWLADLSWLLAWPAAWLAWIWHSPLLLFMLAIVHCSLQLHLGALLRQRREAAADQQAAERLGQAAYAQALARYLTDFEPPEKSGAAGRGLRRSRLRALGLNAASVEQIIDEAERLA